MSLLEKSKIAFFVIYNTLIIKLVFCVKTQKTTFSSGLIHTNKIYYMTDSELTSRIRKNESFLMAGDGQFLGQLSSNRYSLESVMNEYGSYGSRYSSTSIFNPYCIYGNQVGLYSPFNYMSYNPPRIYLRGLMIGYLTINTLILERVDPNFIYDFIVNNGL